MLIPIFISSYQGKIRSPYLGETFDNKNNLSMSLCLTLSLLVSHNAGTHTHTHATHTLARTPRTHLHKHTHTLSCSKLTRNDKIFVAPRQRGGLAFIRNLTRGSLLVPNKPFPTKVGQKFDFLETLLQLICSFADIVVDTLAFPMILTI